MFRWLPVSELFVSDIYERVIFSIGIENLHASIEDLNSFSMNIDAFPMWVTLYSLVTVMFTNGVFIEGRPSKSVRVI